MEPLTNPSDFRLTLRMMPKEPQPRRYMIRQKLLHQPFQSEVAQLTDLLQDLILVRLSQSNRHGYRSLSEDSRNHRCRKEMRRDVR
jgi:hypothetical protein